MVAHDKSLFLLFSSCIFWSCSSLILYRISFHPLMSWALVHLLVSVYFESGVNAVLSKL